MLEEVVRRGKYDKVAWDRWRKMLIDTLGTSWRIKCTVSAISEEYFDNYSLLFPEDAKELHEDICVMETLVRAYNGLKRTLPGWKAIDLDALRASSEAEVSAAVAECVERANAKTVQAAGGWKESWEWGTISALLPTSERGRTS
jgi:hypothetical protein